MTRAPALRNLAGLAACLALAGLVGCQTLPDLERARGLFSRPQPTVELPFLHEEPPTPLAPVRGVQARSGELRAILLRWEPVLEGEVAGYVIDRALEAAGPFHRVGSVVDRYRVGWLDRGQDLAPKHQAPRGGSDLGDGFRYAYRVRAFAPDGSIAPAEEATVATGATAPPPAPPTGFQAFSHLPRRVALRWDVSDDVTTAGYVIYRSPSARGAYDTVAQIESRYETSWSDLGLGDLRVFYYRIASRNAAGGVGEPSASQRAVTKPEPLPPIGLALERQEVGRNTLRWEPNVEPDIERYELLKRAGDDAPFRRIASVEASTPHAVDGELGAGERAVYAILAVDRDGLRSAVSRPLEVMGIGYALEAESGQGEIRLRWSPQVQQMLVETRVLRVGTFGERELGRTGDPHFEVRGLEPGQKLRVRLVGVRADGSEAPPSAVLEVQIPPDPAG